jgi:hypothetical protein
MERIALTRRGRGSAMSFSSTVAIPPEQAKKPRGVASYDLRQTQLTGNVSPNFKLATPKSNLDKPAFAQIPSMI